MQRSIERARAELAERLRERKEEIEEALLTRIYAIADPKETADPEYALGLRAAVSAALEYGLAAVERGEERAPPVPVLLLAQARLAARNGIPLDTVLRRYFAGYTLLGDFIVQEAGAANLKEAWLKRLLREQAATFDSFLAAVTEEHGREGKVGRRSPDGVRTERVEQLLKGELVDTSKLEYNLDLYHVGAVAIGRNAAKSFRELVADQDKAMLLVRPDEETVWAWLGSRRAFDEQDMAVAARKLQSSFSIVALGALGRGLAGWRLTHRQAMAALGVARRGEEPIVTYGEVSLLTAVLRDEILAEWLRQRYCIMFNDSSLGGPSLRDTFRAYLKTGRNISSAAAALSTSRRTVTNRLRTIEERLGKSLNTNIAELELALQLLDLESSARS